MRWSETIAVIACALVLSGQAPIEYRGAQPSGAPSAPTPTPTNTQPAPISSSRTPAPIERRGASAPNSGALIDYALQPAPYVDPRNGPRTHRVVAGDTLYGIAAHYQVPLGALIDQNALPPPFALTEGQELQLPPPRLHRVEAGQTLADVARRYNVDLRSLALMNNLNAPYTVRPGQEIVLPALARALPDAPPAPMQATPVVAPAPSGAAPRPATPAPVGAAQFAWPVRGDIVTRFGAQAGGRRSDGVEIAAQEGAQFGAAADGEVVYAGGDLPAYGTLIMVRHANGFVTAYAYARRALVSEGARVRRGQPIGEVGQRAGDGRLLFQVRRGSQPLDPLPLLGG